MYTPAQQAAIAIVAAITPSPPKVGFALLPVFCDGLEIGFVPRDQVSTLTEAAKASPAQPVLRFESAIRGGTQMGLLPTICLVVEDEDHNCISVTMDGRRIDISVSIPGECMSLTDGYGAQMGFDIHMADAIIAAMQALKARADG